MADVLEFKDVTVRRGGREILRNITWEVESGQRWVILGPNGAGKTTTVQLASGRMFPTEGTVSIVGEQLGHIDVSELWPLVGLSSTALDARIPGAQSVRDVVQTAAYGNIARWRETYDATDTARAMALLNELGVGSLADREYATLSSGEMKRVGIARALMPNPEVLILDEPTSGLDLGGRESLLAALSKLALSPLAPVIALVTHHVEEIPPGFTHALLLKDGAAFAGGPIEETITSQNLSELFGLPLHLEQVDGRYWARAL